ncbi:MAG: hypothetical protein AB8B66_02705 [Rickettsiaceae bacterium]
MTNKEKLSWLEIVKAFSEFEEKFDKDVTDPTLLQFFDNFADRIIASDFNEDQLKQVNNQMANLRKLFTTKAEALKKNSNEAVNKHNQLQQYIKNSNYKNQLPQ